MVRFEWHFSEAQAAFQVGSVAAVAGESERSSLLSPHGNSVRVVSSSLVDLGENEGRVSLDACTCRWTGSSPGIFNSSSSDDDVGGTNPLPGFGKAAISLH